MFSLSAGLPFADLATPAPLREAFGALLDTPGEVAGLAEPGLFVEVFWAALHGLVTLTRAGRLHRSTPRNGSTCWSTGSSTDDAGACRGTGTDRGSAIGPNSTRTDILPECESRGPVTQHARELIVLCGSRRTTNAGARMVEPRGGPR
jgi:hypothetical protein